MGLRGVDDVKESVRAAAGALVRALRGISLRIMDLQQTQPAGETTQSAGGIVAQVHHDQLAIIHHAWLIRLVLTECLLLSLADVAGCCCIVLPLLSGSLGLGSSVDVVRGVSADVICSGLKTAGSAQVSLWPCSGT